MRVFIDKGVHASIEEFYDTALFIHHALDEQTVLSKVNRLYDAMEALLIRFIHCRMEKKL